MSPFGFSLDSMAARESVRNQRRRPAAQATRSVVRLDKSSNVKPSLGDRVRKVRALAGMNQKEFAEAVNVSQSSVTRWERGERSLDVAEAAAICARFGVEEKWFLTGGGKEPTRVAEHRSAS